jgi:hypothetical protein
LGITQKGISQNSYRIRYIAIGFKNINTGKWDWNPKQEVNLQLTLRGNLFLINDQAGTYFVTNEQVAHEDTDDYLRLGWWASDEKDRSCLLKEDIIKKDGLYTGRVILYIFYKDFAYCYELFI